MQSGAAAMSPSRTPPTRTPPPTGGPQLPGRVGWRFVLLGSANLGAAGAGFLATLLIARGFGAEGLGLIALSMSLLSFGTTIALFGTDLLAVRQVAAHPRTLWPMLRTVTRLRAATALLAYLGLLGAVWAVPGFRDVAPLVAIFGLSLPAVALSAEWVPQALHRTGITAMANMGLQAFYLTFLGLGLLMGMPLLGVAVARVTADALVALGFRLWAWRRPRPDADAAPDPAAPSCAPGRVARAAAPICATQIVRTLALTSDMLLLGLMVPADSLGHYAAASRLFYVMMSLATAYFIIVLPRIAAAAANPPPALRAELRDSLRRTVPLALAGTLLLAPLSPVILSTMFGAEFAHAAPALAILGAATAASLIGRHYRQVLLARSRQVDDLRLSLAGSAVHVAAKLALIPFLGITGAALGTFLGETFILLVQRRATRSELDR